MVQSLDRVENYFKLHKTILSSIGLWPYQTSRENRLAVTITFFIFISLFIPQFAGMYKVRHNFGSVIECIAIIACEGLSVTKLINLTTNNDKVKVLLMRIQSDFDSTISGPEVKIIKKYGEQSIRMMKIYAITCYTSYTLFTLLPLLENSLPPIYGNNIMNVTKFPKKPLLIVDYYFIDTDSCFYLVTFHIGLSLFVITTTLVATDGMFMIFLQHGTAKFMILKYRLSQVIEGKKLNTDIQCLEIEDLVYEKLKICVHLHEEAIRFADMIESTYTICQLFQVCTSILLNSVVGLHIATRFNKPDELMRFFGIIIVVMVHLSFYSWLSHELMDQSVNVSEAIYNTEWYRVSKRTQKLLLQMKMRSRKGCKITAGKLYLMSMENYCQILSRSMSYFTMLSSVQGQPTVNTES